MFLRNACFACALPVLVLLSPVTAIAGGYDNGAQFDPPDAKWSGLYIGLHAGYGWGDIDSGYDFGSAAANNFLFNGVGLSPSLDSSLDGYIVGGQIGLQRQVGHWVVGVEGTASATGMDGSPSANWAFGPVFGISGQGVQSLSVKLDNLYTATGRLGYTHENWLAYVKGGYATADIDVSSNIGGDVCLGGCRALAIPVSLSGDSEKRHDGWVIGGGIERMIYPNLTLGVEYNYIDLGSRTHSVDGSLQIGNIINAPVGYKLHVDPDAIQTVSVRLNFLLNGPDHPAAVPLK